MKIDNKLRFQLVLYAALIAVLAFTALLIFAFFRYILPLDTAMFSPLNLLIIALAFGAFTGGAIFLGREMLTLFAQHFHNLSSEDAAAFVGRLLGLQQGPLAEPTLRVQDGRANPDGPDVLYKVGGPGYLSIAHNSAAVTSRLGKLHRVLGPGGHHLETFERPWDVIDLRPQRRTVQVGFMTRDGIPAHCAAEIRFRVAPRESDETLSGEDATPNQPYPFSEAAVLKLMTEKTVNRSTGSVQVADWCAGISGALAGTIRNYLETYSLDDFLNPRYWEARYDPPAEAVALLPLQKPVSLKQIEAEVEQQVKDIGFARGILVDWVHLEPVVPDDEAIAVQWLEFRQTKADLVTETSRLKGEEAQAKALEQARTDAQIELLTNMLNRINDLKKQNLTVPSQLIVMSFIEVIRTLSERDPNVQMPFPQAESLIRIFNMVRQENLPSGSTIRENQQALAPTGDETLPPDDALPADTTA